MPYSVSLSQVSPQGVPQISTTEWHFCEVIGWYKSNIYQPCSGSQLTCFVGFSIGNFISVLFSSKAQGNIVNATIKMQKTQTDHEDFSTYIFCTSSFRDRGCELYREINALQNRIVCACCPPFFLHLSRTRGVRLTVWDTVRPFTELSHRSGDQTKPRLTPKHAHASAVRSRNAVSVCPNKQLYARCGVGCSPPFHSHSVLPHLALM